MTRKIKRYAMKAIQVAKHHKAKIAAGMALTATQASALTADVSGIETDVTTTATSIIAVVVVIFAAGVVMSLLRRG